MSKERQRHFGVSRFQEWAAKVLVGKKQCSGGTEGSEGRAAENPKVHVAPSGTLYIELEDLVPLFMPTERELKKYIENHKDEIKEYIQAKDNENELRRYIEDVRSQRGEVFTLDKK